MPGLGDANTTRVAYLVQHGESEPESRDPERPLTAVGRQTVERVAAWAGRAGLEVQQLRHSGKLRAQQTAALFAEILRPPRGSVSWPGLAPNDDVRPVAEELTRGPTSVMIVGHLPFLSRLVGLMLADDPERALIRFRNAGLVGLVRQQERWAIACMVPPELVT
jgi:phosphohistidine phosphatase